MKDFPINNLLSATELDRIREAVQQIFQHLRKIRSTKYPMQRALKLVEAISRDLNTQLLKVGFCFDGILLRFLYSFVLLIYRIV